MLKAKSLRKATIPPTLLQYPSPASLNSNRLALHVSEDGSFCSIYVASGCRVYKLQIHMEDASLVEGKDNLLIPVETLISSAALIDRCPHRSEIQNIVLAGGDNKTCFVLGTVDSYGHLIVSRLETTERDVDWLSYSVLPRDLGIGEGSWAGISFCPEHWSTVAVGRSFCRIVDIYDQDIYFQSLHTLWYPSSLCFLSGRGSHSSLLAVAEGSQISIWDLRMKENGGCAQRICGSIGDIIYAICSSPTGEIGIGGSDRTVTIYEPRRWCAISRWVGCSKYEITGLSFSSIESDHIYVQGVDYEVCTSQCHRLFANNNIDEFVVATLSFVCRQTIHNLGISFWLEEFVGVSLVGMQVARPEIAQKPCGPCYLI